jgi:hypothetical protein
MNKDLVYHEADDWMKDGEACPYQIHLRRERVSLAAQ